MLVPLPDVLDAQQVRQCRQALQQADWSDGRDTAGHLARDVKRNLQLPTEHPLTRQLGDFVLEVLGRTPGFIAAALPLKVLPPLFNRYTGGGHYGNHVDRAVGSVPGTPHRVRTDLSATLFLSDPQDYDGGELVVQDTYGEQRIKLPAGHLVLYPGTSVHRVEPVTRGERLAAFFWVQSLVRLDVQRSLLYELDGSIQRLHAELPDSAELARLTGVYHNLLRLWSET